MPSVDIFIPQANTLNYLFAPLFSMPLLAAVKDSRGCYIACNQVVADYVGMNSPKNLIGMADFDLVWCDYADNYRHDDQQIEKSRKPNFFIEPTRNSKNEVLDFLTVKAPLLEFTDSYSGVVLVSIPLNQNSFNNILSQFFSMAEKLKLNLDLRLMIRIVTQAMQLNNAHTQWKRETELFDYGEIKFTLREAQCLHYFLNNYSADKTSEKIHISRKTVEFHLMNIKKKLNCFEKSQITNKAIDLGFIDLMFMTF